MISIQTTADETRKFLQSVRKAIAPAALKEIEETITAIENQMVVEGESVKYPIDWDSEKQRKAYFATKGFGKGIPYKRTGEYQRGWKVEHIANGYKLENKSPAGAVGGFMDGWQSRIHRGRWQSLTDAVRKEMLKLPISILERLHDITESAKR